MNYERMPLDWDDARGWDDHFKTLIKSEAFAKGFLLQEDLLELQLLALRFQPQTTPRIWVAGCGVSLAPHYLAALGFNVTATDISPTAIATQHTLPQHPAVQKMLPATPVAKSPICVVHDFRAGPGAHDVNLVLNRRAFQHLPPDSMSAAAQSHYTALAQGGIALFSTSNMSNRDALNMETALAQAGFQVAGVAALASFRQALEGLDLADDASFVFVPGQPILLSGNVSETVQRHIRHLASAFLTRYTAEKAAQQAARRQHKGLRRAQIIYMVG